MNWKYTIGGDDFILTQEEHEQVRNEMLKGKTQFWLRGGNLMINTTLAWHISSTRKLTDMQEKAREEQLQLDTAKGQIGWEGESWFSKHKDEFYKKLGWPKLH